MITVTNDFKKRVSEIEAYFKMLESIINQDAKLFFPNKKSHKTLNFSDDLTKILRANCFLLLYNLVESSITHAITEIFDTITKKNLKYKDVITGIQQIWITDKYSNLSSQGAPFITEVIANIKEDLIILKVEPNLKKQFAGNLDPKRIREIAAKIGFSTTTHYRAKEGKAVHRVKIERNKLGHGEVSFAECGRGFTLDELIRFKREVVIYLESILRNIEKYLNKDAYKR